MNPFALTPRTPADESKKGLAQGAIAFALGASLGVLSFLVLSPRTRPVPGGIRCVQPPPRPVAAKPSSPKTPPTVAPEEH